MFNQDFYPTPPEVIATMLQGVTINNKIILEPSAGKGDIIDYLNFNGCDEVLFCEINEDLQKIIQNKGKFLTADFLALDSAAISHIDLIVMNPPFSKDTQHILHAFNIAPAGCKIITLCNAQTYLNPYAQNRKELKQIIDTYGSFENLGNCFATSERVTGVEIGLIVINKAGEKSDYSKEFEGFFLDDEEEPQGDGIMSYNLVRDLVNRYIESIKIFDRQLEEAERMGNLTKGYFSVQIGMTITDKDKPIQRAEFKKEMQKSGWSFIFSKMNMKKYATKGLKEDINSFVETQQQIPFTMKNIYHMLNIVVGTTSERMNRAAVEVFDKVTAHYHENRYGVEGWKTNSHYFLTRRFIFPNVVKQDWGNRMKSTRHESYSANYELLEDLVKVLAYQNGDNYDKMLSFDDYLRYSYRLKDSAGNYILDPYFDFPVFLGYSDLDKAESALKNHHGATIEEILPEWGKWNDWGYFRFRAYKKGTCHLEFKDAEVWGRFNQKIAEIKGYPLFEKAPDKRTDKQKQKAAAKQSKTANTAPKKEVNNNFKIIGTFNINNSKIN